MVNRVFVVHGWMGSSREPRYVQLKKELKEKGFEVYLLDMPNTENPKISEWVSFLGENVGEVNEETYFIGHSVGCQTILRYFEGLNERDKVGGVVLLDPWVHLLYTAYEEPEEEKEIAKPWLETEINWDGIKVHCGKFVAIYSDDDPYVPLSDKDIFEAKLDAKIILEHGKGHFPGYDNDAVVNEILEMAK